MTSDNVVLGLILTVAAGVIVAYIVYRLGWNRSGQVNVTPEKKKIITWKSDWALLHRVKRDEANEPNRESSLDVLAFKIKNSSNFHADNVKVRISFQPQYFLLKPEKDHELTLVDGDSLLILSHLAANEEVVSVCAGHTGIPRIKYVEAQGFVAEEEVGWSLLKLP